MIMYDCRKTIAAQISQKFSFKKRCGSLKAVNFKEGCCDTICREKMGIVTLLQYCYVQNFNISKRCSMWTSVASCLFALVLAC